MAFDVLSQVNMNSFVAERGLIKQISEGMQMAFIYHILLLFAREEKAIRK